MNSRRGSSLFSRFGQNCFEKLINPIVLDAVRDVVGRYMVLKKIEEVQPAKQEEQRLTILKALKQIEAETRLIEVTTQARAQAERQRIETDAKAYRILTEATARANRLVAESLTDRFIRYKAVEKWDGKYPSTLFAGREGGLILNLSKGRP